MSNLNFASPLGSMYNSALRKPSVLESILIRAPDVTFSNQVPRIFNNRTYRIAPGQTVQLPSSNTYINADSYNLLKLDSDLTFASENVKQTVYFTSNGVNEKDYIVKTLPKNEITINNIPVIGTKFRIEYKNESSSNVSITLKNSLLYFTQFHSTSHSRESQYNPVNNNAALNNCFYDDVARGNQDALVYKSIRSFIDVPAGQTTAQLMWNTANDHLYTSDSYTYSLKSDNSIDSKFSVDVKGLDINGDEIEEAIDLDFTNGTTPVTTTKEFLRINSCSGFKTQTEPNKFNYGYNYGNVHIYPSGSTFSYAGQEFIGSRQTASSTAKYSVPRNKEVIVKDITITGTIGNYQPEIKMSILNSILPSSNSNILMNAFTTRFDDSQTINQTFKELNIKVDELQEFSFSFDPRGTTAQNSYISMNVNFVEYAKKNYFKN